MPLLEEFRRVQKDILFERLMKGFIPIVITQEGFYTKKDWEAQEKHMYYKIYSKTKDKVVPRIFEETPYGTAINPEDQIFADEIVREIQEACRYFYEVSPPDFPGCPEIEGVSDDEIEERINRINSGENEREATRTSKKKYPLNELPYQRKRALIERIERIKKSWQFERIDKDEHAFLLIANPPDPKPQIYYDPMFPD